MLKNVQENSVAWWNFESTNGTNFTDKTANFYQANSMGSTVIVQDNEIVGSEAVFDGTQYL